MKRQSGLTVIELLIIIAILGILVAIGFQSCSTSDGTRVGFITKFSNKGLVCKTFEGELVMGGMATNVNGQATANVWKFSVVDAAIADKVEAALESGARVQLKYHQILRPSPCTRETSYVVTDVKTIGDIPPTATAPAPTPTN